LKEAWEHEGERIFQEITDRKGERLRADRSVSKRYRTQTGRNRHTKKRKIREL